MTSLTKGANTDLAVDGSPVRRVVVGISWDAPTTGRHPFDLDLSVVLADAQSHAPNPGHLVFAQQLAPPATSAAVADAHARESGSGGLLDLTGPASTDGPSAPVSPQVTPAQTDDEELELDLAGVPGHVDVLAFILTIHDASSRNQSFADLASVLLRVSDDATGREIASFTPDLTDAMETSMALGEVYRRVRPDGSTTWKVRAVGQGSSQGLAGVASAYGIER